MRNNLRQMKSIFMLGLPIALQSALLCSMGFINSIMTLPLGEEQVSTVGVGARWLMYISLLLFSIGAGMQILLSHYHGSKNQLGWERAVKLGFVHFSALSGVISLFFIIFPDLAILTLTNPEFLSGQADAFMQILGVLIFVTGLSILLDSLLRSKGIPNRSLYIYLVELSLNIALNFMFIYGLLGFPAMGVIGVIISSLIARSVRTVMLLFVVNRSCSVAFISKDIFQCALDKKLNASFYSLTWPLVVSAFVWASGAFAMHMIIGRMGSAELTVISILAPFEMIALALISCVCCGASIAISHALGAKDFLLAKSLARNSLKLALIVGGLSSFIFVFTGFFLLTIEETLTAEVSGMIFVILPLLSISILCRTITGTQIQGVLKSGGDMKFCMYLDMIAQWVIAVPIVAVAGLYFKLSLVVVYCLIQIEEILKILPAYFRIRKNVWLNNLAAPGSRDLEPPLKAGASA